MMNQDTIPDMVQDTIILQDTGFITDSIKPAQEIGITGDSSVISDTIAFPEAILTSDSTNNTGKTARIDTVKESRSSQIKIENSRAVPEQDVKPDNSNESGKIQVFEIPVKDSIHDKAKIKRPVFSESVLAEIPTERNHASGQNYQENLYAPDWQFYLLMGALMLVAWMRSVFGGILKKTYQATISFSVTLRMYKDNSVLQKQLDGILTALYFLSTGFYFLLLESKFNLYPYDLSGFIGYLFNIGILILIYFGRSFLLMLTGFIFNQRLLFDEYRYHISVFNKLTGLVLLPFILLINYSEGIVQNTLEWLSVAVVGSIILLRLYRGFIFSAKKGVLIFYLFLYLCALELVPVMVIFKWIQSIV